MDTFFLFESVLRLSLFEQRDNPQQQASTYHRSDKATNNGRAPMNAYPSKDISTDETADNADEKINNKAEAGTFHEPASQKTSQCSDDNTNNDIHNVKNLS